MKRYHPPRTVAKISDSALKEYQRCPRRWAYRYLLKLDPQEDKWSLIYGNGMHTALEWIHKGSNYTNACEAGAAALRSEGKGEETQEMFDMLSAMIDGYCTHFLPMFNSMWKSVKMEEWFEHSIDEFVQMRGKKDLRAESKSLEGHTALFDFKSTSYSGGGPLGRQVGRNVQLARYSLSHVRQRGAWPQEVGLIFLQKPKLKSMGAIINSLKTNASLYSMATAPVNPQFAEFAMALEQADRRYGWQIQALQRQYDEQGVAMIGNLPANFNACEDYNRLCGFAAGCHCGKGAHTPLVDPGVVV